MSKHQPVELKMSFHEHYQIMWPFIKPYTFRALLAILISIPIGALDSVVALSLKPYMDIVLVDKTAQSPTYIPFLIIDMVIASVLMSMGMMMLPPSVLSLPFKIIFFVMIDGWHMLSESLVNSFH